jgi:hypothetical protein
MNASSNRSRGLRSQFIAARFGCVSCFVMDPLASVRVEEAESAILLEDGEVHVLEPAFSEAVLAGLRVLTVEQETYRRPFFTDLFLEACHELGLGGSTQIEWVWDERDGPVRRPPRTADMLTAAGITPARRALRPLQSAGTSGRQDSENVLVEPFTGGS